MTQLQKVTAQVNEEVFLTEDNLTDLIWLVQEYGHYLGEMGEDNTHTILQTKLEQMLDQCG